MNRINLGNSDLKVSRLCLGCWQFNVGKDDIVWKAQDEKVSHAIVDKCIELGVNFFDTAEAYSRHGSETVLGNALQGRRRDAIIATKFGFYRGPTHPYTAVEIEESLTESLRCLKTDYIDLYQVHGPWYVENMGEAVAELKRQQSLGRIRYYGVSNFGDKSLNSMAKEGGKPVTNQIPYSLLWRAIEYEMVESCDNHDCDIIAYSPLQQGMLSGDFLQWGDVPESRRRTKFFKPCRNPSSFHQTEGAEELTFETIAAVKRICSEHGIKMSQASLSWLLAQKRCASVIVGASRPEQVVENNNFLDLSKEVINELSNATEKLKEHFGDNCDQYSKVSRFV